MSAPAEIVKLAAELVKLIGVDAALALLKRALTNGRKEQLKANYEMGKRVFKRKRKV